jgi:hypothetical protein
VRSAPAAIDCGATCTATFDAGTPVALAASPEAGYRFSGWSGACTGAGGCALTMSSDALVSVKFEPQPPPPKPVILTVSVTGPGSIGGHGIDCPGATCAITVEAGTALTLWSRPASGARLTGWGGACGGRGESCALAISNDASVTALFEQEVITLVPADGTLRGTFALNSTHIFFERSGGGGGIWSVPKSGGVGRPVAYSSSGAMGMVADDRYVYWTDDYWIYRAPVDGGRLAMPLYRSGAWRTLALDGERLYWTTVDDVFAGSFVVGGVWTGRTAGGMPTRLAMGNDPNGGVAVDDQYVYWTGRSEPLGTGSGAINRVPKTGGAVDSPIQCGPCVPIVVRVDSQNIYYRNNDGDTWARAKSGGDFIKLSSGNPRQRYSNAYSHGLDVYGSVAYFDWNDTTRSAGQGLFRSNIDGSDWTAIETSSDTTWSGPLADEKYIYYYHAGAYYRRLK